MQPVAIKAAKIAFGAATLFGFAALGNTTTVYEESFKCPVGGERFRANVIASSTSFGSRPDGRTYGTLPVYPLTECPTNGFIFFKETFSSDEAKRLKPLIGSEAFQNMRKTETQHFRAWWLMDQTGQDPASSVQQLLQATWETDDDSSRKARYQGAFIAAVRALPEPQTIAEKQSKFFLQLRAANALRELTQYSEALGLLGEIEHKNALLSDPNERQAIVRFIDAQRKLSQERNPVSEPANLIPAMVAIERCEQLRPPLSASEQVACNGKNVADARAQRGQ